MSRQSTARRIAAAAAYGGGGITAIGLLAAGLLTAQAALARRSIGAPFGEDGPYVNGVYGHGPGVALTLGALGDSTAAGLGVERPEQTTTAILASGLAAMAGRPVRLASVAKVGATSMALAEQVDQLLVQTPALDVAVILIGANDVTHRVGSADSARELAAAVMRLRSTGAEVVVGTCPDLGTIRPVPRPLRWLARHLSRQLAAAQTIAVVEAGGRTVSIGDMLGPEFDAKPQDLFAADRFHPSAAGYARCGAAMLPSVCAAARMWPGGAEPATEPGRGEKYAPVANAAVSAADTPGTEVVGATVHGRERGIAGRWTQLRRRRRGALVPEPERVAHDVDTDTVDDN